MQKLVDSNKLLSVKILSKSTLNEGFYFCETYHSTNGTTGDIILSYGEISGLIKHDCPIYINSSNERLKYKNFELFSYDITTLNQTDSFENLRDASYYEELLINEFLK